MSRSSHPSDWPTARSTDAVELLDGPLDDPSALAGNLRDLGRINRWLGGVAGSAEAIDGLAAHRPELTLIDVGTGGADIPLALISRAERRGRRLSVVAVDSRPEVVALADQAVAASGVGADRLVVRVADGLALPFADGTFDIAHASLVLHHLEPSEATALVAEMARVARLGIVVNDLQRSRRGWVGAWLMGHLLTGNRYTRYDAPRSVRRAYRADEVHGLLQAAGLVPVTTVRTAFGQRYAIAAVPNRGSDQPLPAEHPYDGAP